MRFPFVSRERYDEKCAELATLRAAHDALLARSRPRAAKAPPPHRDPIVDQMTAAFAAVMGDSDAARAEAERIHREAFGSAL